jgi:hypothetical protein
VIPRHDHWQCNIWRYRGAILVPTTIDSSGRTKSTKILFTMPHQGRDLHRYLRGLLRPSREIQSHPAKWMLMPITRAGDHPPTST